MSAHDGVLHTYTPTLRQRLWRALGYRHRFPEWPDDKEPQNMQGWIKTRVILHVDWRDRVRLLISGKAMVEVETYTEHEPGDAFSASSFTVQPPGGEP